MIVTIAEQFTSDPSNRERSAMTICKPGFTLPSLKPNIDIVDPSDTENLFEYRDSNALGLCFKAVDIMLYPDLLLPSEFERVISQGWF